MKYIQYKLKNVEPLRIADDSTSQSGQTVTLRYIPGTTVRGYVVNQLAASLGDGFEQYKKALISEKVTYMNAYLYENKKELIPSPKGFYEDKTVVEGKKEIQNVVINGRFSEGFKRADLGRFCYFDDDCIYHYNLETGSDLKILINKRKNDDKQNVFRNEYIMAGHEFVGYICVKDDVLAEEIKDVFSETLILGNARSQGLGKCKVLEVHEFDGDFIPYGEYAVKSDAEKCCYMLLVSNTVMRDEYGEYAGLNISELERRLGVTGLRIEYCSTSTVNVKGYNRAWGNKIPTVTMYEQGSVFKFSFNGTASLQNMQEIMKSGIGVRTQEGFGRVLFLKDYEKYTCKSEGSVAESVFEEAVERENDKNDLKLIAANYYRRKLEDKMQERILDGVDRLKMAKSQVGNVRALVVSNRYDAVNGTKVIKNYFSHSAEKEAGRKIQNQRASIVPFMKKILDILDQPLAKTLELEQVTSIMGCPVQNLISEDDLQRMKFDYILELIRYDNRKGAK